MDFSIIICTCNGESRLPLVLSSIKNLTIPEWATGELILVDNNSTDRTRNVVNTFGNTYPIPLKYCFEVKQGLSFARNTGIRNAQGKIVLFTDDDCIVDSKWLLETLYEFRKDPYLMLLGGRVELYNKNDYPITLRLSKEKRLFTMAEQTFSLLPGCNMAFRRTLFQAIGEFDVKYGAGRKIPSAEDSDFFYRAYRAGYKMAYCPNVKIWHNHGRRNPKQVTKLMQGYVIGLGAFYCKYIFKGDDVVTILFINEIKRIIKKLIVNYDKLEIIKYCSNRFYSLATGFCYQLFSLH